MSPWLAISSSTSQEILTVYWMLRCPPCTSSWACKAQLSLQYPRPSWNPHRALAPLPPNLPGEIASRRIPSSKLSCPSPWARYSKLQHQKRKETCSRFSFRYVNMPSRTIETSKAGRRRRRKKTKEILLCANPQKAPWPFHLISTSAFDTHLHSFISKTNTQAHSHRLLRPLDHHRVAIACSVRACLPRLAWSTATRFIKHLSLHFVCRFYYS